MEFSKILTKNACSISKILIIFVTFIIIKISRQERQGLRKPVLRRFKQWKVIKNTKETKRYGC